jgi:hypothetical protein
MGNQWVGGWNHYSVRSDMNEWTQRLTSGQVSEIPAGEASLTSAVRILLMAAK